MKAYFKGDKDVLVFEPIPQSKRGRSKKDVPVRNVVKTNADHIRSMTDDELAYFLHGIYCEGHANGISHIYDAMLPHYKEWLKQPYGGDT